MKLPYDSTHGRWHWREEAAVLAALSSEARERYIRVSLRRTVDFTGQPVTPEWELSFLQMATPYCARASA